MTDHKNPIDEQTKRPLDTNPIGETKPGQPARSADPAVQQGGQPIGQGTAPRTKKTDDDKQ